jgi:hypothetical protein
MSLLFTTNKPETLLARLRLCVEQKHIETWAYDERGDFTHTPDQWRFKAWMRPYVVNEGLAFGIVSRSDEPLRKGTYGVYHGRLAECVTNHADDLFNVVVQTALADARYDVMGGKVQVETRQLTALEQLLYS